MLRFCRDSRKVLPLMVIVMASAPLYQSLAHEAVSRPQLSSEPSSLEWSRQGQWLYQALSAKFYDHAGDYPNAISAMSQITASSGQYESFQYSYDLAIDMMFLDTAEQVVNQWLLAFPNDNMARLALLRVLLLQERDEEAYAQMAEMLKADASLQSIVQIVRLLTFLPNEEKRFNLLKKLSLLYQTNPYLNYYLGLSAKENGYIYEAIAAFDRALAQTREWLEVELMQAETLAEVGELRRAWEGFERLLARGESREKVLSSAIEVLVDHYEWQRAGALVEEFLKINQNDARMQQLRAWLYAKSGELEKALVAYKALFDAQSIALDQYLFHSAFAYEEAGKYDLAVEFLRQVDENSTLFMLAKQQIGLIAFKMRDIRIAQEYFKKLREVFLDYRLEMFLVEVAQLDRRGAWSQAETVLQQALEVYPEHVDILLAYAEHFAKRGESQIAENTYIKILEIDPANIDALNAYGYLLLTESDRQADAASMIESAIRAYPDSPAIQDSYGWLLYRQGKIDEALLWLRRAYSAFRRGDIAAHYIEVLYASGHKPLAQEVYQIETKGQPDNVPLQTLAKKLSL